MKEMLAEPRQGSEPSELPGRAIIQPEDFKYYLYLCDGEVEEIMPATGLRLTAKELVFLLGDLVVARVPRRKVYFVARHRVAVPVLF